MEETTRGPWQLKFGGRPEDDGFTITGNGGREVVCERYPAGATDAERKTMAANAKMIIAVDDLFDALSAWAAMLDEFDRTSDPSDPVVIARNKFHAERIRLTRAAIAKAGGK